MSYDSSKEDIEKLIIEANDGKKDSIISVKLLWDSFNNRSRGTAFAVLKDYACVF